jgi:uncharacterized alkaline shock family protein YloU
MGELVLEQQRDDKIKISEEVIATIAGIAASETESLASMSGNLVDGIAGILRRKPMGKGIKVEVKENQVSIDLSIVMQYGCKIHEVARDMQARVREAVEGMTGMQVTGVSVNVLGVSVDKDAGKIEVVEAPPRQA